MSMTSLVTWLQCAIMFGTIIMYGSVGEILSQKSGNMNLGVPGIMYLGGFAGFASCYYYERSVENPSAVVILILGLGCAFLASALGGLIYCFLTTTLRTNQNVTGLALTTFGMGIANFFGVFVIPENTTATNAPISYGVFSRKIGFLYNSFGNVGKILFNYGFMVYFAVLLAVLLHLFLNKTWAGLKLRSIGENPATADAAGVNVAKYKYLSTCIGCGITGLGGLYYVMDYNNGIWATTGQIEALGWLAVALVIFTRWRTTNAIWGAYLFGILYWLYRFIGGVFNVSVSSYVTDLVQMVPYLVTILVLILVSLKKKREDSGPAALGLSYFREER